jgi:hypothetical protein
MDLSDPHRGRATQTKEIIHIMWLDNPDCALNLTLLHHFENLGWRFND